MLLDHTPNPEAEPPGALPEEEDATSPRPGREEAAELALRDETRHAEELAALGRKVAEWEIAYRAAVRDRELATALAGRPLVPGAATQLIRLWRDEFDAYPDRGEYKVSCRDGRTVSQAVAERLAGPEYAHFSLPSSRGGAASADRDTQRVATTTPPKPSARNLGEAIVNQWREAQRRAQDSYPTIGLNRRR